MGRKIQWLWIALGNTSVKGEMAAEPPCLNFSIVVERSEDLTATVYALDLSFLYGKAE